MNTPLVISRIADACDIPTLKSWISTCRHYHQTIEDYYKRISGVEECQGTWTRTVRGKAFVYLRYSNAYGNCDPIIVTRVKTRGEALLKLYKDDPLILDPYEVFDTEVLGISVVDNQICLQPQDSDIRDALREFSGLFSLDREVRMSADDFYNILTKLKWYMVNGDEPFGCDDPFPSWYYSIEQLTNSYDKQYLVYQRQNETFTWTASDSLEITTSLGSVHTLNVGEHMNVWEDWHEDSVDSVEEIWQCYNVEGLKII